jgi:predicted O-methyltransferase YrrM
MSIRDELIDQIWQGQDPFKFISADLADFDYPHTNIRDGVVEYIINTIKPDFWLELGTMTGGSILKVAQKCQALDLECSFVCVDPFTGDVNMWAWEHELAAADKWRFLKLENGQPTIYDRFRANMNSLGLSSKMVPLVCTSIVGMKLINRLREENRLSKNPDVIYLDSAHEADETFLELQNCWKTVRDGGVVFGDDWSWDAVRDDVIRFASTIKVDYSQVGNTIRQRPYARILENGVIVEDGQWMLFK